MLVEVAFLLVLLVAPLFYLVGTLARVQAGAYAATAAAREAGRAFVTAQEAGEASGRGHAAAGLVFSAHGFSDVEGSVSLSCVGGDCLAPGSGVSVDSRVTVELPLIPDFMNGVVPTSVTLTAHHLEGVDEFRE
ncbi:pilus assembly protein [Ornithinimicrobium panacihumi]|uniref:pilus assembly protein n=1 Tax=Ornithinimicrobium panacihumi TaxID=2008449 RepID=UPI003F8AAF44